jgi:hypothetical protein
MCFDSFEILESYWTKIISNTKYGREETCMVMSIILAWNPLMQEDRVKDIHVNTQIHRTHRAVYREQS